MNKKEVSEIKKNFKESSGFLTVNKVLTTFVDYEKNIRYTDVRPYITIDDSEWSVIQSTLRNVLSTKVGKNLTEYTFPNSSYEEGGTQKVLYKLVAEGLQKDSDNVNEYIKKIVDNVYCESAYEIITSHCTYSIPKKRSDNELDTEMDMEEYKFILTAICPSHTGNDGFVFNPEDNTLWKRNNTELIVDKIPTDGFLFPAFNNRSSDINSVMYYTKTPKKPNISFVENFLQCEFTFSSDMEKNGFKKLLSMALGDELNYTILTSLNNSLTDIFTVSRNETDIPTIDGQQLKAIISEFGVSQEHSESIPSVYSKIFSSVPIRVSNVIDSKTTLETQGIKISLTQNSSDKIKTGIKEGRKCIIIDIDDPIIEVNGVPIKLYLY